MLKTCLNIDIMACSPELGTTEGYPFKIDFNLLS